MSTSSQGEYRQPGNTTGSQGSTTGSGGSTTGSEGQLHSQGSSTDLGGSTGGRQGSTVTSQGSTRRARVYNKKPRVKYMDPGSKTWTQGQLQLAGSTTGTRDQHQVAWDKIQNNQRSKQVTWGFLQAARSIDQLISQESNTGARGHLLYVLYI